ncbi:MAG: cupin protein [Pseudonocardiales bacterium]|nr:cupin protein [Pseudonocardiales bacterium]
MHRCPGLRVTEPSAVAADLVLPATPTVSKRAEGERVAQVLGLERLPGEGGLFRRTYVDVHSSVIYFMLFAPDFSALHALDSVEAYHWYAGSPLRMLLLHPGGQIEQPILGPDLAAGARPQIIVPAAVWQGSSPLGEWTLVGTTMAPPFTWSAFRLGRRAGLLTGWPEAAPRIHALTRT